ncbi:MAG: hypothetical protein QM647_07510 [Asticcacaulis sp.]|uniref:hypothetical protein n=1 Tax=Asticcacaulis sp. TaxID=1872648 RepID=UPI0039E4E089
MLVTLFDHYWWMIFPLGFCVLSLVRSLLRDEENRRTLSLIRSYTDQGKEPPAELLALLRRCTY